MDCKIFGIGFAIMAIASLAIFVGAGGVAGRAVCLFLVASALHFAQDDAPATRPAERCCRGLLLVAGPALVHRATIAVLVAAAIVGLSLVPAVMSAAGWLLAARMAVPLALLFAGVAALALPHTLMPRLMADRLRRAAAVA